MAYTEIIERATTTIRFLQKGLSGKRKQEVAIQVLRRLQEEEGVDFSDLLEVFYDERATLLPKEVSEILYSEDEAARVRSYLENKNKVCALDIWVNLYGKLPSQLTNSRSRVLNAIVRDTPNWAPAPSPIYFGGNVGRQRGFYPAKERDSVDRFIDDCLSFNPREKEIQSDIGRAYKRFCEENGLVGRSLQELFRRLRDQAPSLQRYKTANNRFLKGVRLIDQIPNRQQHNIN